MSERWTREQHALFARLFRFMSANQAAFIPPTRPQLSAEHWDEACHRIASLAADMLCSSPEPYIHMDYRGRVIGVEPTGEPH